MFAMTIIYAITASTNARKGFKLTAQRRRTDYYTVPTDANRGQRMELPTVLH